MNKRFESKPLEILKILGNNVQNVRTIKNISIEQLSEKTGIRKYYLKKIEQGTAVGISTVQLFKLAEVLQVSPDLLLKHNYVSCKPNTNFKSLG